MDAVLRPRPAGRVGDAVLVEGAPDDGNPETAARIRDEASAYLLTEEEIAAQRAEGRRRVERWLEQMAEDEGGKAESGPEQRDQSRDGASGDGSRGKGPRSKRTRPPGASSGEDAA